MLRFWKHRIKTKSQTGGKEKAMQKTMKRILSEYNIHVIEIPRLTTDEGIVISASKVRECMEKPGESEKLLYELLPESTINKIYS